MARHTLKLNTVDYSEAQFGARVPIGKLIEVEGVHLSNGTHEVVIGLRLYRAEWDALGHPAEIEVDV